MMPSARPYQTKLIDGIEAAFADGAGRVLGVLPTAGGKTVCFASQARACVGRRKRVLIAAHRRELLNQSRAKLQAAGVPSDLADVESIQTLGNRLERLPRYGRIILDEAHHATAGGWLRLIESQPDAEIQGMTATPERLDGRGLGDVFDVMVEGPSVGELIAGGYLSPVRVFGPPAPPDLAGLRTLAGDWCAADVASVMDVPRITGDAADEYLWHCGGQPAIAFCATVEHAAHTAAYFRSLGWRAEAVSGATPDAIRDARIAGLADGSVEVLCTCDLISEGLDVPAVACVINLRLTKSLTLFMQQVGRGLRPAPGKDFLVVLDHAGNTLRHGMPDAPRVWSLEGRPRKAAPPAIRQCAKCFAIFAPTPLCPCCGHADSVNSKKARKGFADAAPGELVELSAEDRRFADTPLRQLIKEAKGYTALLELARRRGLPDDRAQAWLENKARFHSRMSGRGA